MKGLALGTEARMAQVAAHHAALLVHVLPLKAQGLDNAAVAHRLGVSREMVRRSLKRHADGLQPAAAALLPPPAPKPRVQTVEEFLAAGGQITVCPPAVAEPTTYTPRPEDAAAMRAYYAAKAAADGAGTWKERNRRKIGRLFFGKAAS
jgi:hypothetical protein